MNMNDENLDYLFSQARDQEPVASLEETKKAFVVATVTAAGGVLATKGLLKLLTAKKWIIMLSTVTIITTGSIIVGLSSNPKEPKMETPITPDPIVTTVDEKEPLIRELNDSVPLEHYATLEGPETAKPDKEGLFELINNEPDFFEENDFRFEADTNGIAFVSQKPPKREDQLATVQEQIRSYDQRFQITENTTVEDLEKIKESAEASGIDFDYKAKYSKNKLTKLRLEIKTEDKSGDGNDSQFIMTSLSIQGEFDYTVAWDQGEDGNVEHIYCGHTEDFDDDIEGALQDAMEELERALADMDFTSLIAEMDSLGNAIAEDFEIDWEELEEELAEHREEIEEALEDIDREEMESIIREITESSAELIELLEVELEEVQKQLEEDIKKYEEEKAGEEERKRKEEEETEGDEGDERRQNFTRGGDGNSGSLSNRRDRRSLSNRGDRRSASNREGRESRSRKITNKERQQLKEELVRDGLIDEDARTLSIYATYKSIKIDGNEIPEAFYSKYEALILELFDIDITNENTSWSWVSTHSEN